MKFLATEDKVKLTGRTLFDNDVRYLSWSGSSLAFTFVGIKASAHITSNAFEWGEDSHMFQCWIAVYVNNEKLPSRRICIDKEEGDYVLYDAAENGATGAAQQAQPLTITIVKYSEATFGKCGIHYIEIDSDELLTPPAPKKFKMEIIGDSITCGYGVEAAGAEDPYTTGNCNPTKSYSLLTAKAFDADANLISWSGNGVLSGFVDASINEPSDNWLMPYVYQFTDISGSEKIYGMDESKWERWDFTKFTPDIILVNLGTNDSSWTRAIDEREEDFVARYVDFLTYIRANNPGIPILSMLGTMGQAGVERTLESRVEEAVACFTAAGNENVHYLFLPRQNGEADGFGSDSHPSAITHEKTAALVIAKIKEIMG